MAMTDDAGYFVISNVPVATGYKLYVNNVAQEKTVDVTKGETTNFGEITLTSPEEDEKTESDTDPYEFSVLATDAGIKINFNPNGCEYVRVFRKAEDESDFLRVLNISKSISTDDGSVKIPVTLSSATDYYVMPGKTYEYYLALRYPSDVDSEYIYKTSATKTVKATNGNLKAKYAPDYTVTINSQTSLGLVISSNKLTPEDWENYYDSVLDGDATLPTMDQDWLGLDYSSLFELHNTSLAVSEYLSIGDIKGDTSFQRLVYKGSSNTTSITDSYGMCFIESSNFTSGRYDSYLDANGEADIISYLNFSETINDHTDSYRISSKVTNMVALDSGIIIPHYDENDELISYEFEDGTIIDADISDTFINKLKEGITNVEKFYIPEMWYMYEEE